MIYKPNIHVLTSKAGHLYYLFKGTVSKFINPALLRSITADSQAGNTRDSSSQSYTYNRSLLTVTTTRRLAHNTRA